MKLLLTCSTPGMGLPRALAHGRLLRATSLTPSQDLLTSQEPKLPIRTDPTLILIASWPISQLPTERTSLHMSVITITTSITVTAITVTIIRRPQVKRSRAQLRKARPRINQLLQLLLPLSPLHQESPLPKLVSITTTIIITTTITIIMLRHQQRVEKRLLRVSHLSILTRKADTEAATEEAVGATVAAVITTSRSRTPTRRDSFSSRMMNQHTHITTPQEDTRMLLEVGSAVVEADTRMESMGSAEVIAAVEEVVIDPGRPKSIEMQVK